MTKTYYVQLGEENKITDIISLPHGDYVPVELEMPLPSTILRGEYQLINGELVHREDWIIPDEQDEITILKQRVDELEKIIESIIK